MNGKELAEVTANAINNLTFSDEDFCDEMHKEHRTLQQSFMRLALEYIKTTAEQENYDERNRASVEAARKLAKVIEEEHLALPYI